LFGGEDNTTQCFDTLTTFQKVCKKWVVPLAEEKTVLPVKTLTFLGIEFDTVAMELRLPCEKLTELRQRIKLLLGCKNTTLREIQSIIGLINFACQVVVPGCAFCRRLVDVTCKVKKSWRKVRISVGMKKDLQVWLNFIDSYNGVSVMLDHFCTSNGALEFYSDSASGTGSQKDFGIYFQGKWAQGSWPLDWAKNDIFRDITFLELFPAYRELAPNADHKRTHIPDHLWKIYQQRRIL
jgi:hypothetical protein